ATGPATSSECAETQCWVPTRFAETRGVIESWVTAASAVDTANKENPKQSAATATRHPRQLSRNDAASLPAAFPSLMRAPPGLTLLGGDWAPTLPRFFTQSQDFAIKESRY